MSAETVEALRRVWRTVVSQHERTLQAFAGIDEGRSASVAMVLQVKWAINLQLAGTDEAIEEPNRLGGEMAADWRRLQLL